MSSTERAPEPTMEEILSSIRRIITEDEAGQAKAQDAPQQAQPEEENLEGEADNQIIDDIARVLSGGAADAPASEEEEILDLTSELGGLEIVEETEEVVEVLEMVQPESVALAAELTADAAMPEDAPVFVESAQTEPAQPVEEPMQEMAPEPQMAAAEPPVPPQPPAPEQAPAPAEAVSASQEAASALERAIAALRAGQVPTSTTPQAEPFQFQAAPQPEAIPASEPALAPEFVPAPEPQAEQIAAGEPQAEPEPIPMAVPMEAFEPQAETHPESEPQMADELEPDFEAQPETAPVIEPMDESEEDAELVLTEVEMTEVETTVAEAEEPAALETAEEESEKSPFWPIETGAEAEAVAEPAPEPAPVFEPEPALEPMRESMAAQVNGAGAHHEEGPSRTLEDSIKDMLRPMLRQWLDENMPRMIKDELDPDAVHRQQD